MRARREAQQQQLDLERQQAQILQESQDRARQDRIGAIRDRVQMRDAALRTTFGYRGGGGTGGSAGGGAGGGSSLGDRWTTFFKLFGSALGSVITGNGNWKPTSGGTFPGFFSGMN